MAYLALYRRYRPDTFDKLIGQENVVKTLVNQIKTGRLGHAYLFTGTRGTGKTSAAKIFAKAINCEHPINGSPCGECESCRALSDPSNIDVIEIDAASNNGVNEIRDISEKVQYPPVSCKFKVYIIDEVHMLSIAAFNALLKTLEEPPRHAVFILATTEVHKIPATILSRCMRFDFKLIPTDKIAALISKIYDEEGKLYDKEAINAIAAAGEGSLRDALSIADIALSFGEGKLTYNDVMEILGATNFELLSDFTEAVLDGNSGRVLEIAEYLFRLGKSMGVLIKDINSLLRNLIVISTCAAPNEILMLPEDIFSELKRLSEKTNKERILRAMEIFSECENSLKYSNQPRMLFEIAAIKAAKPQADYDIDALLARIKTLEDKIESGYSPVNNPEIPFAEEIKPTSPEPAEKPVSETEIKEEHENSATLADIKDSVSGKLLTALRQNGHEMLWNVMQSVAVSCYGNILILATKNEGDEELLNKNENKAYIKEALKEYAPFEIQVKIAAEDRAKNEFTEATESIKKIFGDDIVIIKDE